MPIDTIDLVEFAVEFADAEIGGGQAWQCWKTWHWEVAPMKGQTVLKLAADYGCVHTHCLLPAHSRYYGETPTVFATVAS